MKSGAGPAPLLTYKEDADLVRVLDIIGLVTPFYLLMHKDMQQNPRVRAFADFVGSEIKSFRALLLGRPNERNHRPSSEPGAPAGTPKQSNRTKGSGVSASATQFVTVLEQEMPDKAAGPIT